ncbi:NADPH:quinone reductase [Sedimentitalea sp. JM2-8]|uniref:NADPH:quinone reductase n=1 Tax=Sedimentitalea xiamensis TaxID=3050037 RepID=A0ABT7FJG7_9RHOB|nr:NADPH:quinone reductase [Sedimentitalea xiamensis]MDK3075078.1 NADPH:quinone reductase [Sedimentitalea xiamensis]
MKAITYSSFGQARDVLRLSDIDTPAPAAGEVTVDLAFSGVNPSDVKARAGSRPGVAKPPFPLIVPHSDGSGVISAIGTGVDPARIGQRVWIWNGQWRRAFGTAATQITLPEDQCAPLPDKTDFETGACLGIPGLTACFTVFSGGDVADKTLLIQGGAGTVGLLAVQLAKWGGAHVIATAHGPGMDRARAAGADVVLDYSAPDLATRLLAANQGRPVDRIIEVEFGANIATDSEVIAENGVICAYGSALNMTPELPFYPLLFKAVTIEIALIYLLTPTQRAQTIARLTDALTEGALHCPIQRIYPLTDCAAAHVAVETGQRTGAILLQTA